MKSRTLGILVQALAGNDPDGAERIAWSIPNPGQENWGEYEKALALAVIARAVAATDPDRAAPRPVGRRPVV